MSNAKKGSRRANAHQQTIADEASATLREGERQAAIEQARVLRAAEKAAAEAAKEITAMSAKETFWERLKHHLFLD